MNKITLLLSGKELLCIEEYYSLLVALEAHQLKIEYQCRGGYCGSCRCRLVEGKVYWLSTPLAFLKEDEILPCCCKAAGNISIAM